MVCFRYFILISLCFLVRESLCGESNLDVLFDKIIKKEQSIKSARLVDLINRAAPSGVEALNPAVAEYETFRSDKSANFLSDGNGHLVYRQFRRVRISDLLSLIPRQKGGNIL